jgi:hypothetical protein
MADVHTKAQRSYNMSRIRSSNTKPELLVRKFLFAQGYRYKLNDKKLPGKPDIVLPKHHTVIFVHACLPVGRAAFGMAMEPTCLPAGKVVNTTKYHKPVRNGGLIKLTATKPTMPKLQGH